MSRKKATVDVFGTLPYLADSHVLFDNFAFLAHFENKARSVERRSQWSLLRRASRLSVKVTREDNLLDELSEPSEGHRPAPRLN